MKNLTPTRSLTRSGPILLIALAVIVGEGLQAQSRRRAGPERNRGAAVVTMVDGDIRVRDAQSGDWIAAEGGLGLQRGDRIETGFDSRAELEFEPVNFARLDEHTTVTVGDIGRRSFRMRLEQGELIYSVWKGAEADVEIDVGELTVRPLKAGVYRIRKNEQSTVITVRKGVAEVDSPDGVERVKKGRQFSVRARDGEFRYRLASAGRRDGMDDWSTHRDKILRRGEGRARPYRGHLYAYGGYPYHLGLGYYGYPYRHFGFGVRTVFVGGRRGFGRRRGYRSGRR